VRIDQRRTSTDYSVDLSGLNNGEWKTACLFGGYTNPLDEMRALGANISEKDRARMTEAGSRGLRLSQVEEYELANINVNAFQNQRPDYSYSLNRY
jgi:hypothetical protein